MGKCVRTALFDIRFSQKHWNFSRSFPSCQDDDGFQNRDKVYCCDFVTDSYGGSWDSCCEESRVPVQNQ